MQRLNHSKMNSIVNFEDSNSGPNNVGVNGMTAQEEGVGAADLIVILHRKGSNGETRAGEGGRAYLLVERAG